MEEPGLNFKQGCRQPMTLGDAMRGSGQTHSLLGEPGGHAPMEIFYELCCVRLKCGDKRDNDYWPVGCSSMARDQLFQHPQASTCLQPCEALFTHLTVAKHMLQKRRKQTALLITTSFTMTNSM